MGSRTLSFSANFNFGGHSPLGPLDINRSQLKEEKKRWEQKQENVGGNEDQGEVTVRLHLRKMMRGQFVILDNLTSARDKVGRIYTVSRGCG